MPNDSGISISLRLERLQGLMVIEKDDMVLVAKKCPYCGATNPERRTRFSGHRCRKCKRISVSYDEKNGTKLKNRLIDWES
jgi:transposase-like protein